jgi:hypothetical protein
MAGIVVAVLHAGGSAERFEGVGLLLAVVTLYAVCVPRDRWARESGAAPTDAVPWHRRMTPFLLGAGAAYVLAATLVGYWYTAAYVAVGLLGACAALVSRGGEPTTGRSTWRMRTAVALLAGGGTLLIPALLGGDRGAPTILAFCLGLVGVAVATDGRHGRAEPLLRS